ncbi:hypothetical protein TGARI_241165 [Toxoplasma gondii ARI]|uniref:Uncharacterized protein n=2 Tax=Toxoplasma gondii TaxID=5811 RepID=A0A2G8Y5P5_TOXGO|nr:hypothetical protein TGARI_241165 [Toxoplasma gondii ARI]PIM02593.1 hypothetical protein TGCOUG_241165 [Toxoplasma gondii COUG]
MAFNRRTDCTHGNPVIGQRAWKHELEMHQQRLRNMKPQVDTRAPASDAFHRAVRKDFYTEQRKKTNDAFENLKMLRAIANTMNRSSELSRPQEATKHSLNEAARRRELLRIYEQNQLLLHRLEATKPVYVMNRTEREFLEQERWVSLCSYSTRRLRQRAGRKSPTSPARPCTSSQPRTVQLKSDNHARTRSPLACPAMLKPTYQTATAAPKREDGHRLLTGSKSAPNLRSCNRTEKENDVDGICDDTRHEFRWKDYTVYPTSTAMGVKPHRFKESDLTAHRQPFKKKK